MSLRGRIRALSGAVRRGYARRFGVDPRALVALRVALAALLLADLLLRARSLVFFYTDAGALPRALLGTRFPVVSQISIHTLSGEAWWAGGLFVLAGIAALAMLAGYRTRTAAIVSWVLLVSLHARNPVVLNSGDSLLRRTLLWSLFLPLGTGLSLGAARVRARVEDGKRGSTAVNERCTHPAAAALVVQPVVLYVVNAVIKLRGDVWPSGRAIRMVFSIDAFTVLLGEVLADYPVLLETLGIGWLVLLCCSPLLVLTTGRARVAVVGAFAGAHVGMALTLAVGLFPLISVAALLPLLPPRVWDAVESRWPGAWLDRWVPSPHSDGARRERVAAGAGGVRAAVGRVHQAGGRVKTTVNRIGVAVRRGSRALAALLLVVVLLWNAASLGYVPTPETGEMAEAGVSPTETRWDMFAPLPPTRDVWYVAAGTLHSGEQVEVIRGGPVAWEREGGLGTTYPSARWRKYLEEVRWSDDGPMRRAFLSGLCARWNRAHDGAERLESVTLYRVEQPTRLDEPEPTERVRVRSHDCSGTA